MRLQGDDGRPAHQVRRRPAAPLRLVRRVRSAERAQKGSDLSLASTQAGLGHNACFLEVTSIDTLDKHCRRSISIIVARVQENVKIAARALIRIGIFSPC